MSRIADQIANAGAAFGANLREATEDMADASGFAGPGMGRQHQDRAFEFMLEKAEDELRFSPEREDAARTLFIAKARIAYFGLHAPKSDLARWNRLSHDAYQELALAEVKAA